MTDDKSRRDNRDRFKVAGGQDYEVQHLADKTGITVEQARELIKLYGNNRSVLEEHARRLK